VKYERQQWPSSSQSALALYDRSTLFPAVESTKARTAGLGTQETVAPNDICLAYDNFLILYLPQKRQHKEE